MIRTVVLAVTVGGLLLGCSAGTTGSPADTASGTVESQSAAAPTAATATGDLSDPCTLLTADQINAALGTSFEAATATPDPAREIVTCTYRSADGTQIVDVGVSQTPGADAFETNRDLAPAYFGGKAKPITIPGADKAYLVIADTYDAPVIGMLAKDTFILLQVGVADTTAEQGEALAAQLAAQIP